MLRKNTFRTNFRDLCAGRNEYGGSKFCSLEPSEIDSEFFSEISPCFPRLRTEFLTNNVSATMFLNVERSHTRNEKAELLFCELRAPEGFSNYIWLMVISRNEIRKQIHQRKLPEARR